MRWKQSDLVLPVLWMYCTNFSGPNLLKMSESEMYGTLKVHVLSIAMAGHSLMKCLVVSLVEPQQVQRGAEVWSRLLRLFLSQFCPEHMCVASLKCSFFLQANLLYLFINSSLLETIL